MSFQKLLSRVRLFTFSKRILSNKSAHRSFNSKNAVKFSFKFKSTAGGILGLSVGSTIILGYGEGTSLGLGGNGCRLYLKPQPPMVFCDAGSTSSAEDLLDNSKGNKDLKSAISLAEESLKGCLIITSLFLSFSLSLFV
jgi:hypothetical protein